MFFKKRELRIKVEKADRTPEEKTKASVSFERRAELVFRKLEDIGTKVFIGACVIILLETRRQIEVEKIKQRQK